MKVLGAAVLGILLTWGLLHLSAGKKKEPPFSENRKSDGPPVFLSQEKKVDLLIINSLFSLKGSLDTWGYTVHSSPSYEMALSNLRYPPPGLIVGDISGKGEQSMNFLKLLRWIDPFHSIKVIFLDGHPDFDRKLLSLLYGADEYMALPFDSSELKFQIGRLLNDHRPIPPQAMKKLEGLAWPNSCNGHQSSIDEQFLDKVYQAIIAHYEDENFDVSELAEIVNQSRSNLFRKIKEITGQTPNHLIRQARIIKSLHLLQANAGTISEIAYSSGFSSLSYFSKVFTSSCGISPSTFMESYRHA